MHILASQEVYMAMALTPHMSQMKEQYSMACNGCCLCKPSSSLAPRNIAIRGYLKEGVGMEGSVVPGCDG